MYNIRGWLLTNGQANTIFHPPYLVLPNFYRSDISVSSLFHTPYSGASKSCGFSGNEKWNDPNKRPSNWWFPRGQKPGFLPHTLGHSLPIAPARNPVQQWGLIEPLFKDDPSWDTFLLTGARNPRHILEIPYKNPYKPSIVVPLRELLGSLEPHSLPLAPASKAFSPLQTLVQAGSWIAPPPPSTSCPGSRKRSRARQSAVGQRPVRVGGDAEAPLVEPSLSWPKEMS